MRSVLFTVFGFPVHSYGLMMVIGFTLAMWRATKRAKTVGIAQEKVADIGLAALIAGIIGARLTYVLLNIRTEPLADIYKIWQGGLSFHGGVIFGMLAVYMCSVGFRIDFWRIADLLAPSVAIGYAFTRIGCFLNGCCYGGPTDLPWGVRFIENGRLTPPSHPTQLYACLANLVIFWLLTRVEKADRPTGSVFWTYIGLYGIYRFIVEFFRRGYSAQTWLLGLTQAQWASIVMILAGLYLYHKLSAKRASI